MTDARLDTESLAPQWAASRRRFFTLAAVSAAAVAVGSQAARAGGLASLRIGTFDETNPTAILQASGSFTRTGATKVVWSNIGSGGAFNTTAAAGGIDIGLGLGTSPVAAGLAAGIPYQIIGMCDNIAGAEEMSVRVAANIKTPADFVGKKVATPFGSTSNFRLVGFLTTHGLLGKVKVLYMSPPEIVAAWKRGEIDAAYVWPPAKSQLLADGGAVFETYKQLDKAGYVIGDLIACRNAIIKSHPDVVVAFLKAYGAAVDLWTTDRAKAVALCAKGTGISPAEALADMKEYEFITLKQSLSQAWLGAPGKPGRLADILHRTAGFLHGQKSIPTVPAVSVFAAGINSAPLAKAIG
ncbi:MAG: ABC transporter substrate-binding protein [Acetobacteraceae bacterium]